MAEGLAPGREADLGGRAVDEMVSGVGLQQTGLLIVGGSVDDAVDLADRAAGVDRVERGVDALVLPRRHAGLNARRRIGESLLLLLWRQRLDLLLHHLCD